VDILALDATADAAPNTVFQAEKPDLLVICGGATPRSLPIPELSWTDFSVNEAEDAVQETMLRAWRGFDDFEARASIKNWLYRIATNVALSMVTSRAAPGRTMPDRLDAPSTNPPQGRPDVDTLWVEPYPDAELANLPDTAAGPDARYELAQSVRLAFLIAIQQLPPRQRAALLLADVLGLVRD
jgi:RNA polymerase sigma-70 factor (ECF subfamily)